MKLYPSDPRKRGFKLPSKVPNNFVTRVSAGSPPKNELMYSLMNDSANELNNSQKFASVPAETSTTFAGHKTASGSSAVILKSTNEIVEDIHNQS